jgi:hypothetical protein
MQQETAVSNSSGNGVLVLTVRRVVGVTSYAAKLYFAQCGEPVKLVEDRVCS